MTSGLSKPSPESDRAAWESQARADMERLGDEDLTHEPDAWTFDESGDIRVCGTDVVVPSRLNRQACTPDAELMGYRSRSSESHPSRFCGG
ncbi:hypothetical protein SAMN05216270_10234 [Glycomyces harbinensis]|uniref:Uncharacterized protein n=2 Tax=Glycomyces harbinensis TaxID=58114 RepID=A0A1G6SDT9_9ACTN|nr:hypothetical protein SAMN05216270_10234 [Glycomyces harbinensis]